MDVGVPYSQIVQENRSKEGPRQGQTEVGGETDTRGGEALDCGKGRVGQGQSTREMRSGVEQRGEEEAEPFQACLRVEDFAFWLHWEPVGGLIHPAGSPVHEFSFRDGE